MQTESLNPNEAIYLCSILPLPCVVPTPRWVAGHMDAGCTSLGLLPQPVEGGLPSQGPASDARMIYEFCGPFLLVFPP